MQLQAIVRRPHHVQGLQTRVASDPVIDVHHQVAGGERRGLGQEIGGPAPAARAGQAVAENVGLGDHRQAVGFESGVERQDGALRSLRVGGLGGLPIGGQGDALQSMVGQHHPKTLGGALGPGGEQHPFALAAERAGVVGGGLE